MFASLIGGYEENNQTLSMSMEELVDYIMDLDEEDPELENGTNRLLLN